MILISLKYVTVKESLSPLKNNLQQPQSKSPGHLVGTFLLMVFKQLLLIVVVVVVVAEVDEAAFLPSFVQQEPFLQLLLPHDFAHDLLHLLSLLSFEAEAVCCCCPKAKPVIPVMATAKKIFFMIVKGLNS